MRKTLYNGNISTVINILHIELTYTYSGVWNTGVDRLRSEHWQLRCTCCKSGL